MPLYPNLKKYLNPKLISHGLSYDLELIKETGQEADRYTLKKVDEVFTGFEPALLSITTPLPGKVEDFMRLLQEKLDDRMETPPVNKIIERPFE